MGQFRTHLCAKALIWRDTSTSLSPTTQSRSDADFPVLGAHTGWLARREWQKTPGERASPFRQWLSSARHGPIGVAISHVPEGKRLSAVVSISQENALGARKPMIVALARKLLIALWRLVRQGVVPDGVGLRPTQ
jgi:hypothetical protein